MEDLLDVVVHPQYQTEVPRVKPTVTQFNVPAGCCCRCGCRVQGRHPEQTSDALGAAASQLGPLALGLAAEMKVRLGISFGKIVDFFRVIFGVRVSRGGLAQSLPRLALAHGEDVRGILDLIRQAPSVNSDSTSWWIGGRRASLAVFATESLSLYVIGTHFTHEVVEFVLGPEFVGVLGSDCGSVYDPIEGPKQKCLGHIIKDLAELSRQKIGEHLAFPLEALVVLRTAIALKDRRAEVSPHGYAVACGRVEARLDRLLEPQHSDADNERLANRMRKHREALTVFLYNELVEPTDNLAERELRPAIIARKLSAGNRSERGARAYAVLASVQRTMRRCGMDWLESAVERLRARRPLGTELWTPGPGP
jgi:transposase